MSNVEKFLFTSESVSEGHPDKICDQVSDAILDECLRQDEYSMVACESCTKTGMIMLFGEITTTAHINYQKTVRDVIKGIGYDDSKKGFDYNTLNLLIALEEQSKDIGSAVHNLKRESEEIGAGDQGLMFGYATNETEEYMPLTHVLSTKLIQKLKELRSDEEGKFDWLLPDAKTQVTVEYEEDLDTKKIKPIRVHTVVVSTQHTASITTEELRIQIEQHVIRAVIPEDLLDDDVIFHIQPSGKFLIGGPQGDAGLTGRKIIVDTYGGWGAHGGGCFSGKDPSKVDRSGAYAARWIAKSLVKAELCDRVLVQVSYAIGVAEPISIHVDTYGTGKYSNGELTKIIKANFDLRPGSVINELKLRRPIYQKTAVYGHFGRDDPDFTWETPKELNLDSLSNNNN
eukprot:TRINITY_DN2626_c0_g1_i1.p1 TRINITY_DN2626_c0_g1~~TRINITY_DN2626_c0_g1_i1.p1  ORF type:complete len:400 (+),score=172.82 TRINITY_DN2626_c0_g1_i1:138-1337(+)